MNLAIVHNKSLEYYPPVCNLMDYLSDYHSQEFDRIVCYSTDNTKNRVPYAKENIVVHRFKETSPKEFFLKKILKIIYFNLGTLIRLILQAPDVILYYEPISLWPVYIYKRFVRKKVNVCAHFHEYLSPEWYASSSGVIRYYHSLENKYLFEKCSWISHTNENRLKLFLKDHPHITEDNQFILPNYPPRSWVRDRSKQPRSTDYSVKFVYVGSFSLDSTYILEFCKWISQHKQYSFDIYGYNFYQNAVDAIQSLGAENIFLHDKGIEYQKQPDVLGAYDIGLILYNGRNKNYVYNAPNKLFEYLACGLEVWFSDKMKEPFNYMHNEGYPTIKPVDFLNMEGDSMIDLSTINRETKDSPYFCEAVYLKFFDHLKSSIK